MPPAGNGPCVTAQWLVGATRVLAGGQPVLLQDSRRRLRADGHAADRRRHPDAGDGDVTDARRLPVPHRRPRPHRRRTDDDDHIRDLIEQVLFTAPGERVNRPTSAAACCSWCSRPNSDALAAATQLAVQGALQQWLGDLIEVEGVDVDERRRDARGDACATSCARTQERRTAHVQPERGREP